MQTAHGETIFETVGHQGGGTTSHSVAQIVLPPACASRRHYHPSAEETYYILSGEGEVEVDGERRRVAQGDSLYIRPGEAHQIANTGASDLIFIAICVPAWTPDNSVYLEAEPPLAAG